VILLFWFLILALALAWGIAGFQEERIAANKAPPAAHAPAPTAPPAAKPPVPTVQEAADGTTAAAAEKESAKPDDAR